MLNQKAPNFTLEATTGQNIVLNDLLGSFVILVFYPANDTPVCDKQLNELSISNELLLEHNARVFGINTASATKSRAYCTRKRLEFPILSDPGGVTAKKYKAYWGWLQINKRTVVVTDPSGLICFYERGTPSPDQVIACIKERANEMSASRAAN